MTSVSEFNRDRAVISDICVVEALKDGNPDIGALWELCIFLEWDRRQTVDGIAAWLDKVSGKRILDCACGSGFPALDLIRRGYDVTCSDGSLLMVEHFRRNSRLLGVSADVSVTEWADLASSIEKPFDVVMCRGGGSLLYAGTWDEDAAPDRGAVTGAIDQFVACLQPGGLVYVDITRAENLSSAAPQWNHYPPFLVGAHEVEFNEVVTVDFDRRIRTWQAWLSIDGLTNEFERRSHLLTHEDLVREMESAGLKNVHHETVSGETYAVFVGTKR